MRWPLAIALAHLLSLQALDAAPLPETSTSFLETYCWDCHDSLTEKGDINLEVQALDWSEHDTPELWESVYRVVARDEMPPKDKPQPNLEERERFTAWVDHELRRHVPIGGTLARRLNRDEYRATIESLFGFKSFELPLGFPTDRESHGFDNLGEGLSLAPALFEAYEESARLVTETLFPPEAGPLASQSWFADADDLVLSYSSGKRVDGALRLGMKCDPIQRSCTWPSKIEIAESGLYQLTLELSTFRPSSGASSMLAQVFARDVASADGVSHRTLRLLHEVEVSDESPQTYTFQAELYTGQTPVVHWANARLDSDRGDREELKAFFRHRDTEAPGYLAAWGAMIDDASGQGFRGGIGWARVQQQLERDDLPTLSEEEKEKLLNKIASNPVLYAETVVYDVFENGPALEVHSLQVDGPRQRVDGPREKERRRLQADFYGDQNDPRAILGRFLGKAFRRPLDAKTLDTYHTLYQSHRDLGNSHEAALSVAIRGALISPRFLYRCLQEGPLDAFDLATRLAYFLTGGPPDDRLRDLATSGELTRLEVLTAQAQRLLPKDHRAPLVRRFTGQWLDTDLLEDLMPDARFGVNAKDIAIAREEVERFFAEMLIENRPMVDFIDPDFTWTSARIAKNIYGLSDGFDPKKANQIHRVQLKPGGRYGGILGQAAVLMATANGVDTQPVLRGVWVLENVLGTPPPPPPSAVPALTPDTTGTTNPRELLAAHTEEASCARCHQRIDPIGLVLENYDPVGRWREAWPDNGGPIDAATQLADGTPIADAVAYKRWLRDHAGAFSQCLAEKLLTYATGRVLNHTERREIADLLKHPESEALGFQDLLIALIQTETFRTK